MMTPQEERLVGGFEKAFPLIFGLGFGLLAAVFAYVFAVMLATLFVGDFVAAEQGRAVLVVHAICGAFALAVAYKVYRLMGWVMGKFFTFFRFLARQESRNYDVDVKDGRIRLSERDDHR